MAFPNINWDLVYARLKEAFDAQGTDTDFKLVDGSTFTLKGIKGHKRDQDLTDGITQQGFKMRVLAPEWDDAAGKEPSEGDQLTVAGRRHAIDTYHKLQQSDRPLMYVLVIKG